MYSPCPYICDNKNSLGHCNSAACVNPKYNTQNIILNRTLTDEEVEKTFTDLELIQKYTSHPIKAEDIYTFIITLCDNAIDEHWERFDLDALTKLKDMFVGKTGIVDSTKVSHPLRIYDCYIEQASSWDMVLGEPYYKLKAKVYIIRNEINNKLISEIENGDIKEVHLACATSECICSICGKNMRTNACNHTKGKFYENQYCYATLSNPIEVYEWHMSISPQKDINQDKAPYEELSLKPCPLCKSKDVISRFEYAKVECSNLVVRLKIKCCKCQLEKIKTFKIVDTDFVGVANEMKKAADEWNIRD